MNWFELVMGSGWVRLHPSIRNRLNNELYGNKPVHFRGVLRVKASTLGRVFGFFADFTTGPQASRCTDFKVELALLLQTKYSVT
jgi:hypothetical protein